MIGLPAWLGAVRFSAEPTSWVQIKKMTDNWSIPRATGPFLSALAAASVQRGTQEISGPGMVLPRLVVKPPGRIVRQ